MAAPVHGYRVVGRLTIAAVQVDRAVPIGNVEALDAVFLTEWETFNLACAPRGSETRGGTGRPLYCACNARLSLVASPPHRLLQVRGRLTRGRTPDGAPINAPRWWRKPD